VQSGDECHSSSSVPSRLLFSFAPLFPTPLLSQHSFLLSALCCPAPTQLIRELISAALADIRPPEVFLFLCFVDSVPQIHYGEKYKISIIQSVCPKTSSTEFRLNLLPPPVQTFFLSTLLACALFLFLLSSNPAGTIDIYRPEWMQIQILLEGACCL